MSIPYISGRLSYLKAKILYHTGQYRDAEATIHPVIQITLATLGSNHPFTIDAIRLLSNLLVAIGLLADADRLARHIFQSSEKESWAWIWYRDAISLVRILSTRKLYEESISLCHHIMKWAEANPNQGNFAYLDSQIATAEVLCEQGKVSESSDMLRELVDDCNNLRERKFMVERSIANLLAIGQWALENSQDACVSFKFVLCMKLSCWME